jgi:hypothetical protein
MAATRRSKNCFEYLYDYVSGQNWKLTLLMAFSKGNETIKVINSLKYHTYHCKIGMYTFEIHILHIFQSKFIHHHSATHLIRVYYCYHTVYLSTQRQDIDTHPSWFMLWQCQVMNLVLRDLWRPSQGYGIHCCPCICRTLCTSVTLLCSYTGRSCILFYSCSSQGSKLQVELAAGFSTQMLDTEWTASPRSHS